MHRGRGRPPTTQRRSLHRSCTEKREREKERGGEGRGGRGEGGPASRIVRMRPKRPARSTVNRYPGKEQREEGRGGCDGWKRGDLL